VNALAFELPSALEAREPPEERGVPRDAVRLLVATRSGGEIEHRRFLDLPAVLDPGDLLVVNVSATLPAAVGATCEDGSRVRVHVATRVPRLDDRWRVVEVRSADGSRPRGGHTGALHPPNRWFDAVAHVGVRAGTRGRHPLPAQSRG